jgi:hypothetical protein
MNIPSGPSPLSLLGFPDHIHVSIVLTPLMYIKVLIHRGL